MHVERKKYELDAEGKLVSKPEHLIRVRVRKISGIVDSEIILKDHPDNIGLVEYNYIVKNLFGNGK